ncbi:ATPase components of ABC transporters with duplicated ATPase domains [Nannocystis exedens]|uniref:ATPase components of ABC transporters with duplicated ATPase domains n=1 Tax=Nannocystis exedens TaxID=54 RepID=A0A1I1WNE2_9BACT|nr:ATP-binding cassette domain-containing protein [Nannocystis exedens]PCC67727.1 ABC transporter [Nannocystis exedens]SFD94620.1 ATPase components of ABC transporters with duplicated ATPase domains [Nannocystis exedens]
MATLLCRDLAFSFGDLPLLSGVDLHLVPGWTGLVGANGAGKTTLLRLLAGELEPTGGSIQREPLDLSLTTCPQSVEACTPEIARFAARDDGPARRLHGELALTPAELARWASLSPGERKRWQIGAALVDEPDVLLLDEPTNHLDHAGRKLLIGALRGYRGLGVVVSHDRALLDGLTDRTLRVTGGEVQDWWLPYSRARRSWEAERAEHNATHAALQSQHRRLEGRLDDQRRALAGATAHRSRRVRGKGKHDSDARTLGAATLAEWSEKSLGRGASVLRRALDRSAAALADHAYEGELGGPIAVAGERAPSAYLAALDVPELRVGDRRVLGPVQVALARDAHVRLAGPNGAGKTTLIRALLARLRCPPARVLYVPQDMSEQEAVAHLDAVRSLPPDERGKVLAVVAALGVDPGALLRSRRPSPGEARKLLLAFGLGRPVWGLVLDEPTNHLDLPAVERLETALAEFPGALLVVSHDDAFARACTRVTWRIDQGELREETAE